MAEVDVAFIQEPQHRPNLALIQDDQGIPIIDLSCPDVDDIGIACKRWGFFQIINHGVPAGHRQKMEEVEREFFRQSMEKKMKVRRGAEKVMGYYEQEHTKNVRDWKEVFDLTVKEPTLAAASVDPLDDRVTHWGNQWPQYPTQMREVCEEYGKHMFELAMRLLSLIAKSMGLPARRFDEFFEDHSSSLRMTYYPPCPSPELVLGVGPHKDPGVLSIVGQDAAGGLEVKRKSDGRWVGVKPTPDAYVINVGDVMQVWTNGEYESAEHRVMVRSEKGRYSTVFFLYPSHYTTVEPLEEVKEEQNSAKYRPYNWGKFLLTRKCSNFKKLRAENLQIHHFKV